MPCGTSLSPINHEFDKRQCENLRATSCDPTFVDLSALIRPDWAGRRPDGEFRRCFQTLLSNVWLEVSLESSPYIIDALLEWNIHMNQA